MVATFNQKVCFIHGSLNPTTPLWGDHQIPDTHYGESEYQNLRNLKIRMRLCVVLRFFAALPLDYDLTIGSLS